MSYHIYLRMFGYVFTIALQVGNIIYMTRSKLKGEVMLDPVIKQFAELQFRYFTCWTFGLQIFYSAVGLSCDILTLRNSRKKNYELPKHLRGLRDTLFAGIQWPSNLLVFTLFWTLFLYDRALVLPKVIDNVLSSTSNHIIHTAIIPIVMWEIAFRPRMVPKSHKRNLSHLLFHITLYFAVLLYTYSEKGIWIYPIFGKMYGTIYLPIFLVVTLTFLYVAYHIQWNITRLFWGDLTKQQLKKLA